MTSIHNFKTNTIQCLEKTDPQTLCANAKLYTAKNPGPDSQTMSLDISKDISYDKSYDVLR